MILALQTADSTTHISLYNKTSPATPVASMDWQSGRELSAHLLEKIVGFLANHNFGLVDLSGVIIFSGPGSFTSLRIGHSVANALADSLGIPVTGAAGDDWIFTARKALALARPGSLALPSYGAEANITKSKILREGPKS